MSSCRGCKHYQLDEEINTHVCEIAPGEDCPIVDDGTEVVVPCPRCGGECDGYGVIDGIPVCPVCDADLGVS